MCLAVTAAAYLIDKSIKKNEEAYFLNYYKLHKLLYYAQGRMLALHNERLFKEEITAHSCGVFVSSYSIENGVIQQTGGLEPIYMYYKESEIRKPTMQFCMNLLTEERKKVLDKVFETYGGKTMDELIVETKEHDIYKNAYKMNKSNEKDNKTAPIIEVEDIKKFFKENPDL